jgi:hypothetical protein
MDLDELPGAATTRKIVAMSDISCSEDEDDESYLLLKTGKDKEAALKEASLKKGALAAKPPAADASSSTAPSSADKRTGKHPSPKASPKLPSPSSSPAAPPSAKTQAARAAEQKKKASRRAAFDLDGDSDDEERTKRARSAAQPAGGGGGGSGGGGSSGAGASSHVGGSAAGRGGGSVAIGASRRGGRRIWITVCDPTGSVQENLPCDPEAPLNTGTLINNISSELCLRPDGLQLSFAKGPRAGQLIDLRMTPVQLGFSEKGQRTQLVASEPVEKPLRLKLTKGSRGTFIEILPSKTFRELLEKFAAQVGGVKASNLKLIDPDGEDLDPHGKVGDAGLEKDEMLEVEER